MSDLRTDLHFGYLATYGISQNPHGLAAASPFNATSRHLDIWTFGDVLCSVLLDSWTPTFFPVGRTPIGRYCQLEEARRQADEELTPAWQSSLSTEYMDTRRRHRGTCREHPCTHNLLLQDALAALGQACHPVGASLGKPARTIQVKCFNRCARVWCCSISLPAPGSLAPSPTSSRWPRQGSSFSSPRPRHLSQPPFVICLPCTFGRYPPILYPFRARCSNSLCNNSVHLCKGAKQRLSRDATRSAVEKSGSLHKQEVSSRCW